MQCRITGTTKRWYARATAVTRGLGGLKARIYLEGLALRDALTDLKNVRFLGRKKTDTAKE